MTPDPIEQENPPELAAPAPLLKPVLLVVDDEEGPRQSLRVIFKDHYDVLLASNGPEAIAFAQARRIDVAVLDIRMAGMSGIDVLERLKFVDPNIEVVMMTAYETTDTIRQALRLRACDYINKPFDLGTIRAAVAKAMQRRSLESEVTKNNEQLEQLRRELENQEMEGQMAHTRGEIYASIIHDINGPLTVISGFVQLLQQRIGNADHLAGPDVEFVRERLKTVTRQVTNCIEISRRYLSSLRKQTDEAPRVGVNQLLQDLSHLVRVHPSRQDHAFEIKPLAEDLGARMNGTDLIQVLLNLVVNAFQCGRDLSVKIEGRVHREPLDLTQFRDGPGERLINVENFSNGCLLVELSVTDTGPGIPPEIVPKVLQPYFTTKGERQGTGLGLSIVQRLVKEARGALHLQTRVGSGTRFTVYLPAVPLAPASS